MCNAIPCTGNTADQAVNTVHIQLGAAKHLTRPLTAKNAQEEPAQSGNNDISLLGSCKLEKREVSEK